jgi:hypothetical protein
MGSLVIRGGVDAAGTPVEVAIVDGLQTAAPERIVGKKAAPAGDTPTYDATGLTVPPGLIDLQVNGAVGHDLTAEPESLWEVAAGLARCGVTAFVPTIITSAPEARDRARAVLAGGPREDNARFFGSIEDVPRHVLTQGIGTILRARHLLLIATGPAKAAAVAAAVEGPVTASCPAAALQVHPHATVLVDAAAAAGLARLDYYREV